MFKDQVSAETRNLLGQIAGLQQMIIDKDAAQQRRADRAEEKAAAREKRMEAKFNKIMASLGNSSAAMPCPQSEDESEDDKSSAPAADTAKQSDTAERKRTRSPVGRASAAAASSTVKKD